MRKKIIYKALIFVFITLIAISAISCDSNLRWGREGDIIYKGTRYLEIDEPFYYIMDGNSVEIGHIKNFLFPSTFVYQSDINDNLLFSPIGSGRASKNYFSKVYVKEGCDFPNMDTIISSIYLSSFDSSSVYELEISGKSFNDVFVKAEEPAIYSYGFNNDFDYFCMQYDDTSLGQKITKYIDTIILDEYGNIYFRLDQYGWYKLIDELEYQIKKILS